MTLQQLVALNYAWAGRDFIIIHAHAADDESPEPMIFDPLDACRAYGDDIVLGFDGDNVYLK